MIHAAAAAAAAHPGGRWHLHSWREARREGTRRIRATRVYMIGADGKSPDLEVVVEDPRKKKEPPSVTAVIVIHEPGDLSRGGVRVRQANPGPLTVARVKQMGLQAGEVGVQGDDGSRWRISAETGEVTRAGAAAADR
jgi:hypothetical protein